MSKKKVPNPNGKKGGEAHQNKTDEVEKKIIQRKLNPVREIYKRKTDKNGKSRYIDIGAEDKKTGDLVEAHQIGKQNKNGTPVKRERDAMEDIEKLSGIKVTFHPYNIIALVALALMVIIWFY